MHKTNVKELKRIHQMANKSNPKMAHYADRLLACIIAYENQTSVKVKSTWAENGKKHTKTVTGTVVRMSESTVTVNFDGKEYVGWIKEVK